MSDYYNSQRMRNLYTPRSKRPFEISRSNIELFLKCPRCFYIDENLESSKEPQMHTKIKVFKEIVTRMRQSGTAFPLDRKPRQVVRDIHQAGAFPPLMPTWTWNGGEEGSVVLP